MKKYHFNHLNQRSVAYLDIIYLNQPIKPSELANLAGVSRAAITKIMKSLSEHDLIIKKPLDISGHSYEIMLSDKAKEFYNDILFFDHYIADTIANIIDDNESNLKYLEKKLDELKEKIINEDHSS